MSNPWVFTQLSGEKKQLTLVGWNAPFGRPRQKPVVNTGVRLRVATVRYPGNDGPPTRHVFGTAERDWDLNGRWMDKDLGTGGAQSLAQRWKQFVADKRAVRIAWGDVLSYTGLIESLDVDWESPTEATWKLRILIDSDDGEQKSLPVLPNPDIPVTADIEAAAAHIVKLSNNIPSLDTLTGEVFDALDQLMQPLAITSAAAVSLANSFENFESATFDELQRLRTSIAQFRTAYITFSETFDSYNDDAFLFDRQADDDINWFSEKALAAVQDVQLFVNLVKTMLRIDVATRGTIATAYVAKPGDTWESISTLVYGGPADANKIRLANGIRYGELPMPAKQYQIPKL